MQMEFLRNLYKIIYFFCMKNAILTKCDFRSIMELYKRKVKIVCQTGLKGFIRAYG